MAFVNKYSSIIRRSNKSIVNIYEDEKIFFNFYDENNNLIKSKTLSKNIDLSTLHFSLTKNDEIIGLYDDNSLKMIKIDKNDDITNQVVINYDSNQFKTIFPYIEKIDDEVHIFYYVYSLNSDDTLAFFHHYQKDGFWTENNIIFLYLIRGLNNNKRRPTYEEKSGSGAWPPGSGDYAPGAERSSKPYIQGDRGSDRAGLSGGHHPQQRAPGGHDPYSDE